MGGKYAETKGFGGFPRMWICLFVKIPERCWFLSALMKRQMQHKICPQV